MKYEYIKSDIDWLGSVPSHWKIDRLKDKTTNVIGGDWGNDTESNAKGENIVVLRVSDINDIYFAYDNLTYRKIKKSSVRNRLVTSNSLLIEKSGGGEKQIVGRVGYPKGIDFRAICSNFMAKIDFNKTIYIGFINYLFSYLYDRKVNFQFVQQTTGIQNLNVGYYLNTKIAFPPFPEQKAISDFLHNACTRIDRIIEIKEKQLERIWDYYFARMKELTTMGGASKYCRESNIPYLGNINKIWKTDRIKDLGEFNPSKPKLKNDEIVSVIPMEFITDLGMRIGHKKLSFEEVDKGLNKFCNGDMIFAKITPCMENGKGAFVNDLDTNVAFGSTEFFVLRPNGRVNGKFIYYATRTKEFRKYLEANMKGAAGQQRVPSKFFKYCEIAFPNSITEQEQIVNELDELFRLTNSLKKKLKFQIKTLKNYRKSLIHECVTGKKQVFKQEPVKEMMQAPE